MKSVNHHEMSRIFHQRKYGLAGLLAVLLLSGCAAPQPPSAPPTAEKEKVAPAPPPAASTPIAKPTKSVATPFPEGDDWLSLFDGNSLKGWAISDFAGHGEVQVVDGKIVLKSGVMTGVTWTNEIPRMHYAVELEAMRVDGSDFVCALTFPAGKE